MPAADPRPEEPPKGPDPRPEAPPTGPAAAGGVSGTPMPAADPRPEEPPKGPGPLPEAPPKGPAGADGAARGVDGGTLGGCRPPVNLPLLVRT